MGNELSLSVIQGQSIPSNSRCLVSIEVVLPFTILRRYVSPTLRAVYHLGSWIYRCPLTVMLFTFCILWDVELRSSSSPFDVAQDDGVPPRHDRQYRSTVRH